MVIYGKTTLRETLWELEIIRNTALDTATRPLLGKVGICPLLNKKNAKFPICFNHYIADWPLNSGDFCYPIPSGVDGIGACYGYNNNGNEEMWSPEKPYGANRHAGLDYVIQRIEKDLREG